MVRSAGVGRRLLVVFGVVGALLASRSRPSQAFTHLALINAVLQVIRVEQGAAGD
ncbi:MAG: hypothetical protein QOC93_3677 [Actinomycetota bacterium]|nr:hypothetical protein [Cryptosporangiaceae bacterium]MDQ1678533.1 hypothetical protein [Actinomycetota bacterium]